MTLKLKLDENLPTEAATVFVDAGHDAMTVPDQQLAGRPDADIAAICRQEGRVIVTLDLDFADIRAYPPADNAGIIVLRLARQDKLRILSVLRRMLSLVERQSVAGKLWIVDEMTVRVRE